MKTISSIPWVPARFATAAVVLNVVYKGAHLHQILNGDSYFVCNNKKEKKLRLCCI
jgi:hypothetical protein